MGKIYQAQEIFHQSKSTQITIILSILLETIRNALEISFLSQKEGILIKSAKLRASALNFTTSHSVLKCFHYKLLFIIEMLI